jgi:tetratricopeptide (TPR) repeat protein
MLCTIVGFGDGSLRAQAPATSTIPLRLANGRVAIAGDLVGLRFTNEVSLEISFEYPDALTLHPDQYNWLGLDPNDLGLADPPLVHFLIGPGIKLSIPAKEIVAEPSAERVAFQNMMTRLYSSELGEHKLKGTIGIGLLKKYLVTIDLSAKQLVLAPPRAAGAPQEAVGADTIARPFEYLGDRILVGLNYGETGAGRLAIGGGDYDTFIDSRVAAPLGKPAGDVSPVWLADEATPDRKLDLSRYVAFRPQVFGLSATPSADSPTVVAGWNLLESFRVELDWANQRVALTQKKVPHYPKADFEFFQAESLGTGDALQAYLEKYPHERLSAEAATRLVASRLEHDKAGDAEVLKALRWAVSTSRPGRRTETCLAYLKSFGETPRRLDLAIAAGIEGLTYAREAFDARVVYTLHNALGELYLKKSEWDDAWKHFLSAAFMAPDDLGIALNLARVYDHQGQVRRAYARYKKVAAAQGLPPEIETEVKTAMERLRKLLPKDDPLLRDEAPAAGRGRGGMR